MGSSSTRFRREADAREPFETRIKREKRAIAPDVFIEIADADGGSLLAFIELDMGSMSHRRLKRKAAGFAEYVKAGAWRERHRFCPALLFITTTEKRARSFLATMGREVDGDAALLTCACDLAHRLAGCTTDSRWLIDGAEESVDLIGALQEARRPHDEEVARRQARRREEKPSASACSRTPRRCDLTFRGGVTPAGGSTGSGTERRRRLRSPWRKSARWTGSSARRWWRSARCSPTCSSRS